MRRAMLLALLALCLPTAALASSINFKSETVSFGTGESVGGEISPFPHVTNPFFVAMGGEDGFFSIENASLTGKCTPGSTCHFTGGTLEVSAVPNQGCCGFTSFTDSLSGGTITISRSPKGIFRVNVDASLLPSTQVVVVCGPESQNPCRNLRIVGGIVFFSGPATSDGDWFPSARAKAVVNFTPVPEPGTLGLLGTGLIGLAGLARRKLKGRT